MPFLQIAKLNICKTASTTTHIFILGKALVEALKQVLQYRTMNAVIKYAKISIKIAEQQKKKSENFVVDIFGSPFGSMKR
jgi:hypothetical protein